MKRIKIACLGLKRGAKVYTYHELHELECELFVRGIQIADGVTLGDDVLLGLGVRIGEDTTVAPNTIIGDNVFIGSDCLIGPNLGIGNGASVFCGSYVDYDVMASARIFPRQ